jgi:hypothetical protein
LIEAAVGIAQASDARASVDAVLESLEQAISLSEALLKVSSGRPVVLAGLRAVPRAAARI